MSNAITTEDVGGPALFGYCLDILLYGVLTVQTYLYYLAFPNDRRLTKMLVHLAFVIGTFQTGFALRDFYVLFCTAEGDRIMESDTIDIRRFGFMWFTIPTSGALMATIVQLFYAHRIYVISKARVATVLVSLMSFVQLVSGVVATVLAFRPGESREISSLGYGAVALGGTVSAACDVIITVYMSYWLTGQLRGASKTTQAMITKITRLLFETGILTAGMAVAYAILTLYKPIEPCWFLIPGLSLGKLYANSMLVLLNNRFTILGGRNATHPEFDIPSYRRPDGVGANRASVVSCGIAFVHSHPTETTLARLSEEQKEGRRDMEEAEGVQDSKPPV